MKITDNRNNNKFLTFIIKKCNKNYPNLIINLMTILIQKYKNNMNS